MALCVRAYWIVTMFQMNCSANFDVNSRNDRVELVETENAFENESFLAKFHFETAEKELLELPI